MYLYFSHQNQTAIDQNYSLSRSNININININIINYQNHLLSFEFQGGMGRWTLNFFGDFSSKSNFSLKEKQILTFHRKKNVKSKIL